MERARRLLGVWVWLALLRLGVAAPLELYTVPLASLKAPTEEVYDGVRNALGRVGMLAVTLDDAAAIERDVALREFVRCLAEGVAPESIAESTRAVVLEDGTVRTTIAVATNHSVAQPLPVRVQSACPSFAAASTGLRSTVDDTGRAFGWLLDQLTDAPPPPHDAPASAHMPVDSFLQATASAESLEHFHLFTQSEQTRDEGQGERTSAQHGGASTLQLHTDLGLFIIMTPGQYLDVESGLGVGDNVAAAVSTNVGTHGQATATAGLYVQLPSGEVVTPTFPRSSLLLMAGEGATRWVHRRKPLGMYAAAHEVVLPVLAGTGVGRAWYGRMFFPARDAVPLEARGGHRGEEAGAAHEVMTFGAARDVTHAAFYSARNNHGGAEVGAMAAAGSRQVRELSLRSAGGAEQATHLLAARALGCHVASARRQLADEGSCGAGQIWCWMSCQSIAQLDCDKTSAQCRNPTDVQSPPRLWPQDYLDTNGQPLHCFDCVPICAPSMPPPPPGATAPPSSLPVTGHGFCNTYLQATVMWMTGFQSVDSQQPCVALLFSEWALDTRLKFAMGCVGTFLMGLGVEGIVFGRRKLKAAAKRSAQKERDAGLVVSSALRAPGWLAVMVLVYGVQVTMGYLIMLIAMTYQTELFMMVILGLTAGHAVFNLDGPVLESAEACCQGFDVPEETSSDQSGEAAGAYLDLPGSADTDEPRSCCARAPDTNGVPASGV